MGVHAPALGFQTRVEEDDFVHGITLIIRLRMLHIYHPVRLVSVRMASEDIILHQ